MNKKINSTKTLGVQTKMVEHNLHTLTQAENSPCLTRTGSTYDVI